jgi:hypothetical protein
MHLGSNMRWLAMRKVVHDHENEELVREYSLFVII